MTGNDDPFVLFYNDAPRELAHEAISRERAHPSSVASDQSWPLNQLPIIPTNAIVCTRDRLFPPDFMRRIIRERLGIEPDEISGPHCVTLSHPRELADLLAG